MGIVRQSLKFLVHENNYKSIKGNFLSLARQSINIDIEECKKITKKSLKEINFDKITRHAKIYSDDKKIIDRDLFENVFNVKHQTLDISGYEKADIIHDMNKPVPNTLENKFDFIFSGGVLDNIHNPNIALENISKMLKKNGRVVHWECAGGLVGHFKFFCPEWFYSYYSINNFKDVKVYLLTQRSEGKSRFDYYTDIYLWTPKFTRKKNFNYFKSSISFVGISYILVIAEKWGISSFDKIPTNLQYIKDTKSEDWTKMQKIFSSSKRPNLTTGYKIKNLSLPYLSDHFKYLGSKY